MRERHYTAPRCQPDPPSRAAAAHCRHTLARLAMAGLSDQPSAVRVSARAAAACKQARPRTGRVPASSALRCPAAAATRAMHPPAQF